MCYRFLQLSSSSLGSPFIPGPFKGPLPWYTHKSGAMGLGYYYDEEQQEEEERNKSVGVAEAARKFGNKELRKAVKEWCADAKTAVTKYGPISGWDVSEITNMSGLFSTNWNGVGEAAKKFNANLSRWDVSNVTDMTSMFVGAEQFNCNLSSWNVEKVTKMGGIFNGAKKFDKTTIKGWELKGKETYDMFGEGFEDAKLGRGEKKL